MKIEGSILWQKLKIKYHEIMLQYYRLTLALTKRLRKRVEKTNENIKDKNNKKEGDENNGREEE